MNYTDRQGPTEECPLTKDKSGKFSDCCGGGLKIVVCCFATLTLAITAALILQLLDADSLPEGQVGAAGGGGARIHGAVAADHTNCSYVGSKILKAGGNAIDAAVAATVCMTVVAPHKTGLGGGGLVMIYSHRDRNSPLVVDFADNTAQGAFAAANVRVPAVLRGLEFAQSLRGKLTWREVIAPSVEMARTGFVVSSDLARQVSTSPDYVTLYGQLEPGQILKLPVLAETLEAVAEHGTDVLYNGTLSRRIITSVSKDLLRQLALYEPQVGIAERSTFYTYAVYHPHRATSLKRTVDGLNELGIPTENASSIGAQVLVAREIARQNLLISKVEPGVETEKYCGVVAMDWQDTYVSVLTGLSAPFGLGRKTGAGFLWDGIGAANDLASFAPVIFHHEKDVCGLRGVFGTDDVSLGGQLLYNVIVRALNVSAAVEYPRYYVLPDGIAIENDENHSLNPSLRAELATISSSRADPDLLGKSANIIIKYKDSMTSHSDSRGGGLASRF